MVLIMWGIFFGILIGIVYMCVVFYFATEIDKKTYEKGISLKREQTLKYALYSFLWPVTMFMPKLWEL